MFYVCVDAVVVCQSAGWSEAVHGCLRRPASSISLHVRLSRIHSRFRQYTNGLDETHLSVMTSTSVLSKCASDGGSAQVTAWYG